MYERVQRSIEKWENEPYANTKRGGRMTVPQQQYRKDR